MKWWSDENLLMKYRGSPVHRRSSTLKPSKVRRVPPPPLPDLGDSKTTIYKQKSFSGTSQRSAPGRAFTFQLWKPKKFRLRYQSGKGVQKCDRWCSNRPIPVHRRTYFRVRKHWSVAVEVGVWSREGGSWCIKVRSCPDSSPAKRIKWEQIFARPVTSGRGIKKVDEKNDISRRRAFRSAQNVPKPSEIESWGNSTSKLWLVFFLSTFFSMKKYNFGKY